MNIKKRIVPIVLFFALIASSVGMGQWAVKAASDTTGPVLKSISSGFGSANGGGTINAYVTATDDISGVNHAVIWYISPSGTARNTVTLYPSASGSLTGSFIVNPYSEVSEWMVDYVELYDNAGNKSVVYNSETNTFGYLKNLSQGNYYVNSALEDIDLPIFQSISVDKNSTGPNSSVNVTLNASDATSNINYAYVQYISPNGFVKDCYLYPDASGVLENSIEIGQYDEAGRWTVDYIEICDNAGNYIAIVNSELYNDPELPLMNLSAGDFDVIGTSIDDTAPAFQSISVDKSRLLQGEEVNLTIKGSDALSGIDSAIIMYTSASGAVSNLEILYPDSNGDLKTTIATTFNYKEIGKWKVDFIVLFDKAGNWTEVYNTETNTDTSLNLMDLSQGDFEFYVMKYQSEPTGLKGIQTTTHDGTEGKITGTTTEMEYMPQTGSQYIPCTGTEITGLTAGMYYVRYAAKEEYYASSNTLVEVRGPVWDVDNGTLLKYNGAGGDVIVPDNLGITKIGKYAFSERNLTSLIIPNTVTSIGEGAFSRNSKLEAVTLPDGITSIENYLFEYCYALTSVNMPAGITSIGTSSFKSCSTLASIKIPDGVTTIGSFAFQGCYALNGIVIPKGVTRIEMGTFEGCTALSSINIPSGVTIVDNNSFNQCSNLKTIYAYPKTAPSCSIYSTFPYVIPEGAVLYTVPDAKEYGYAPWNRFIQKTMEPESIEVTTPPLKTDYYTGQSLNLTGIIVNGIFSETKAQVPVTMANISGFNSSTPASGQKVTVTVNGKTATFEVNIIDKAFAPPSTGNMAKGKTITSSSAFTNGAYATDGNATSTNYYTDITDTYLQWVQVDLGATKNINEINLWHYFGDARAYHNVRVQISEDPTFTNGVITVYNNNRNASGTDYEYAETSKGLNIAFDAVKGRYVRFYSSGSTANSSNHYVEIEIYGELPIVPAESVSLDKTNAEVETGSTYSLAATVFPADTTNKSVTWSSSDTSVATVSANGVVTGVKAGTAIITATTVDGQFKSSCDFTVIAAAKNLSTGKQFTSTVFNNISSITDGSKSLSSLADDYPNGGGLQYVQMDLGAYYDLTKINLWHYYGDGRKYKDVIVQVSNDPTFATDVTTVYNNDTNNSAGFGAGTEAEYAETSAGLTVTIDKVNARYVRLYSNGSDKNSSNHYVEAEVYGFDGPVVHPAALTLNKETAALEVGGTSTLTAKVMPLNTTDKSVTWSSSNEAVAAVSSTGAVTGVKAGTAVITATSADGGIEDSCTVTVTAVPKNLTTGKLFSSTVFNSISSITDGNKSLSSLADDYPAGGGLQYVQMDLGAYYDLSKIKLWHYYGDGRKYKDVIVQVSNDPTFATDVTTVYNNDTNNSASLGAGTEAEYAETSAGKTITIDMVNARYVRLYSNGSDKNTSNHYVEAEVYGFDGPVVSPESLSLNKATDALTVGGTATLVAKVMPLNTTDKSVTWSSSDAGVAAVSSSGAVTGVSAGKATITATTADGKHSASCEVTVTVAPGNLSAGKLFTSTVFKDLARVTDGSKSTGSFAEDYPNGGGLQYMQLDLGAYYDLSDIKLWHYYGDGRKYKDVIVQVSNDPTFATDVTTVYSNDTDNSAKLGTGTKAEYAETSAGLNVQFETVNARYVRLYSNGSNLNSSNHYVEVEVYGLKGAVVHPSSMSLSKSEMKVVEGASETLAATVMPLNATDKSVIWKSSDESVATVSAEGLVTGVKAGTATITAATVDGNIEETCTVTVSPAPLTSNLSAGKQFTSTVFTGLSKITDGSRSTGSFAEDYPAGGGLQYVQMDLGAYYDLSDIKLWHYFGDGRKYKDVIVQVSNDPTFATDVTTVYSNDTDNSAGLGAGTAAEYVETSAGMDIPFDAVNARYVRFYSNGSNMNSNNHYVEIEIYGAKGAAVHPTSVSLSKAEDTLSVGETHTLTAKVMPLNTTDKSVTWTSSDESVATVSSTGSVTGVKAGTATITAATVDGSKESTCAVTVTEAPLVSNLTAGKVFTSPVFKDLGRITDGNRSTGSFSEDYPLGGGLQYVQVDLGGNYNITEIDLWHYYGDGRKYKDVIVEVSNDPTFKTGVRTVYSNDKDNSAGRGVGTDSEYTEGSEGLNIYSPANGRYVRFYSNGSDRNSNNHYVEIRIFGSKSNVVSNQAAGKALTSSAAFANISNITDGNKATSNYVDCYPASGLQWVQVDLGISYDISDIKLWHYFGDSRTYHDVVVQVSDDPTFKTGVTTMYNNDADNSANLGAGSNSEYTETSAGLDIPVTSVNGRYVRLYSNGSTANSYNHYVELEVYGK